MSYLDSAPPVQFTIIASLIGVLLSDDLDANEQNSLGNFLITIGQELVTISSQITNLQSRHQNEYFNQQIDQLNTQINLLKQQLKNKSKI